MSDADSEESYSSMSDAGSEESYDKEELLDQDPDLEEDFGGKNWPFTGEGDLEGVPMPVGTACLQLSNALGEGHASSFSFGGKAEQLPAIPDIFVGGIGPIPVPLWEDSALKLIEKCEKSPFGHNYDTKLNEKVCKTWQLSPDQVQLKNPQWQIGIEKMTTSIADQLGYQDISLQCKLYKLLVYEEGGHFVKHQDTEKEDGMIATLVIQPPSLHEGGDLVVYANGKVKCRHDFGKTDGTATYLPHYAVNYADAEHAVETVTKGYRLVLVYSVCLPPTIREQKENASEQMIRRVTAIMETIGDGDNSFALLLSREYTKRSIKRYGSGAFKGIDRTRFLALEKANASMSETKKLEFTIALLEHYVSYGDDDSETFGNWSEDGRDETVFWYTTDGKDLGVGDKVPVKFNFLNPDKETYSQLWKKPFGSTEIHGYMGNEGPMKGSKYSRFALIAWPVVDRVEYLLRFVNLNSAFRTLYSTDTPTLRKLMELAVAKMVDGNKFIAKYLAWEQCFVDAIIPVPVTSFVCQRLCQLLEDSGDTALVNLFFQVIMKHIPHVKLPVLPIAKILEKYDWNEIGQALLSTFRKNDDGWIRKNADDYIGVELRLAKELSSGDAQVALLNLIVEKVETLEDTDLCSSSKIEVLWRLVLEGGEYGTFEALSNKFKSIDPEFLQSTANLLVNLLRDISLRDDQKAILVGIVSCRSEWLVSQIRLLDKPFTWEMPLAEFPQSSEVEEFLKSSEESMNYCQGNHWYSTAVRHNTMSFDIKFCSDEGFVVISKTREWYYQVLQKQILPQLKEELKCLQTAITETLVAIISGSRKKDEA